MRIAFAGSILLAVAGCQHEQPVATSQPAILSTPIGTVGNVPRSQIEKIGLDLKDPKNEGILSTWAHVMSLPDYELMGSSVECFCALQLGPGVEQGLVALINRGCTGDPVVVFAIWPDTNGMMWQEMGTDRGTAGDFGDFDGDGRTEIVVRTSLESGSHANAFYWPDVCAFTKKGYVCMSSSFVESYYVRLYLPEVFQGMDSAVEVLRGTGHDGNAADLTKKIDALSRQEALATLVDCREGLRRLAELVRGGNRQNSKEE